MPLLTHSLMRSLSAMGTTICWTWILLGLTTSITIAHAAERPASSIVSPVTRSVVVAATNDSNGEANADSAETTVAQVVVDSAQAKNKPETATDVKPDTTDGKPAEKTDAKATATSDAKPVSKPSVKKVQWGQIEIRGALPEGTMPPGLFGEAIESLDSIKMRLKKAADDSKISGLVLFVNEPSCGLGRVHELRQAIAQVRAAGKPVYAWLESGSLSAYLIACSCEKVVVPPSGMLMMPGLRAEVTFYKNMLDWLQIEPEAMRVGEYKSAAEPYSRTEMSDQFREELEAVLDSQYQQIVAMIAESRKLSTDDVKAAIDVGLLSAQDAKARGLIDHVEYEGAITSLAPATDPPADVKLVRGYGKRKIDTDFSGLTGMVNMMNLMMGVEPAARKSTNPKLAIISAIGPIMTGNNQQDLFGDQTIGSTTIVKAIRQARDDETVKAIVLRVDSPGGSALASDLIWHELETVKKPVIVSMGNVAASGGYYISMGADKIFAEPGTITGSIGVVSIKFATEKFFAKLGMNTSIVQRGKNSGVLSITTRMTDSERDVMQKMLDDVYQQFTTKAAAGRKMEHAALEKLARGRIYTGQQAVELGLVDALGTLDDAVAAAKSAAGIDPATKLERLDLPKAVSPFEQLLGPLDPEGARSAANVSEAAQARWFWDRLPPSVQAAARHLLRLETMAREPVLMIAPYQLSIQ
jgi:protease IV